MTRPRPGRTVAVAAIVVLILAITQTVEAQQGEWRLGGRLLNIDIGAESQELDDSGSRVVVDGSWTVDFDATYMLGTNWGMEFMITAAPHDLRATGGDLNGLDMGSVWIGEATITVKYHIPLWGKWKPYVGGGLGTAYMFSSDMTSGAEAVGISKVESDLMAGAAGQVGVNYRHSRQWMFNFDVKYNAASGDVEVTNSAGETSDEVSTDLNAWIIGLGAVVRF